LHLITFKYKEKVKKLIIEIKTLNNFFLVKRKNISIINSVFDIRPETK